MVHGIYAYSVFSEGAQALAEKLDIPMIKHVGSKFKGRPHKTVINWGCKVLPHILHFCKVINQPALVLQACNKLKFFQQIPKELCPPWTTDREEAFKWDSIVVCRHKLESCKGDGIEIIEPGQPIPYAPLYTMYIKKKAEYRVHWFRGSMYVKQKLRKKEFEGERDVRIRNTANGYVFGNPLLPPPACVTQVADQAFKASGLDFGAADVIYNKKLDKAFVLEINTAPGIEASTVEWYVERFKEID